MYSDIAGLPDSEKELYFVILVRSAVLRQKLHGIGNHFSADYIDS